MRLSVKFKGIVSHNFGGQQIILLDRAKVPDVLRKGYFFNFTFSYCLFKFSVFSG